MTSTYPATRDTFPAKTPGNLNENPVTAKLLTDLGDAVEALEEYGVVTKEYLFTETAVAAGTITGTVSIPAGATLLDVSLHAIAVWDSSGAVTAIVGDVADDNGIFTGVNLKATDLTAGQTISAAGGTGTSGGKEGADIIATHWNRRYLATARDVSCIVTLASTGGTAGRTRFRVTYALAPTTDLVPVHAAA